MPAAPAAPYPLATIGYEGTTMDRFLDALRADGVGLVVDVRAVASSRRPGFSKTKLAAHLAGAEIAYLHLRGLGTPADGRAAARAGDHAGLRRVFWRHLETPEAHGQLRIVEDLVREGQRVCLLCYEADPAGCHRRLIVEALRPALPLDVHDLAP